MANLVQQTYYTGRNLAAPALPPHLRVSLQVPTGSDYVGISGDFAVGVPAAQFAPVIETTGEVGVEDLDAETRFYVYTFVNAFGHESMPSLPSRQITYKRDATKVFLDVPARGDIDSSLWEYNSSETPDYIPIVALRLYRTGTGSQATAYQFVAQLPVLAYTYRFEDGVKTDALGEVLITGNWAPPPPKLQGAVRASAGFMVGWFDSTLVFSPAGVPYATPLEWQRSMNEPVVGCAAVGPAVIAVTTLYPYLVLGSTPELVEIISLSRPVGCVSARSMLVANSELLYVSADGLISVSPQGEVRNLTEDLYSSKQWTERVVDQGITGAAIYDEFYYLFTATGAFAFSLDTRDFMPLTLSGVTGASYDVDTDSLLLANAGTVSTGQLKKLSHRSSQVLGDYLWRSKRHLLPEASLAAARVDRTGAGAVQFRYKCDDVTELDKTVTNNRAFRLPAVRSDSVQLELEGVTSIRELALASSVEELADG